MPPPSTIEPIERTHRAKPSSEPIEADHGRTFPVQEHHAPQRRAGHPPRPAIRQTHPRNHRLRQTRPAGPRRQPPPPRRLRRRPPIQHAPRHIERAIKKAAGQNGSDDYVEVRYEGYGPAGIAIIVEALTDNRNRTASDIRTAFSKHGGTLGESNSVSFMFDRIGLIRYPATAASADAMLEAAIEAGADDAQSTTDHHEITCAVESFFAVRDTLESHFGEPETAKLDWRPTTTTTLDEDAARAVLKLIDALEDSDDVQNTYANFEIPDTIMQSLDS
jgi:conserved hypothetical protein TIGR01033